MSVAGTVYLIPVPGGYVADSLAGKYNTILGAGLIYALGKYSFVSYEERSNILLCPKKTTNLNFLQFFFLNSVSIVTILNWTFS